MKKNTKICKPAAFMLISMLFMSAFCQSVFAQTSRTVRGAVYDSQNDALIGVSVLLKNTTNGTMTDINGEFSLDIPAGAQTLVFTYLGMKTQEIPVTNQTSLSVVMQEEASALGEIVVIGYGTQRREAVTGSVATMSGDIMRDVASTGVSQALQGRIAGVEMTQTNSKPGAEMQIRIRGTRSLSADNNPLIVLDGIPFPGSLNDIDPNSIKSLDILKDASATAIYGSRGANGVILITTNRGTAGHKSLTYSGYFGVKSAIQYDMMNGEEYARLRDVANNAGLGNPQWNKVDSEEDGVSTNWQDLFFKTGMVTNHDVSFTKGTEDGNYSFGMGYYLDQAVVPTQQYSRISLRTSADQSYGKYIKVGFSSNSSYSLSEGNQVGIGNLLNSSPLIDPYEWIDKDDHTQGKRLRSVIYQNSTEQYPLWTKETLEDAKDLWRSDTKTLATYNNIYGEISAPFLDGLKYRINLGLNVRSTTGGGFTGIGVNNTNPENISSGNINNSWRTSWVVENLLTFDRNFDKHRINVTGLYSAEQNTFFNSRVNAQDLPVDQNQYYNLSQARGTIILPGDGQTYWQAGLISWMGRVMYSYDDRYMISAAVRSDASSRLAKNYQWHTYPAVSVGWNMNREAFMEDLEWLDQLKLRVGYGETSNQAIDPYKTLGRLATRRYNYGVGEDSFATGYILSELSNEKLGWEYTSTWNYGIDFTLLRNRLSGTIEYYAQHTKDILMNVRLPSTAGVANYTANIGEMTNKGWEFSLKGRILDNYNGWTWDAGINLYTNKNEIVKLNSDQDRDESNWWFKGYPLNVNFGYEYAGLWQEGDPFLQDYEPGGNVGMIKVKYNGDFNADGSPTRPIGAADRQIIELDPRFQGGFNTTVAYKGFDLAVIGGFQNGGKLISTLYGASSYLNLLNTRRGNVDVDYWTPENTGAKYPRPGGILSSDAPKYGNTLALFDATYLKIRAITLGYNFNQNWLKNAGIQRLRLYVTAQNPFVLFSPYTNETGLDPEPNSTGGGNQATNNAGYQSRTVVVGYNTPATRNYLVGINLTF